jgi:tetratricopeptide (TPR) repeat protein
MDGRFEDAMDIVKSMQARGEEAGIPKLAGIIAEPGVRARLCLGVSQKDFEREIPHLFEATVCLVLAHLGKKEEVSAILDKSVLKRPGIGTLEDETITDFDAMFLEAAVLTGHSQVAELLLNRMSNFNLYLSGVIHPTCIARHLRGAAALLERYDEARKYYQEAVKVCIEMPFRPELALTRLQLAELLLEHYPEEKKEALEHLDFAIKEFREMKMQPSLERALRHKDILKA